MSRRTILSVVLLLVLALGVAPLHAQDAPAPASRLRIIHAAADVPAVDVYVDNLLVAQALAFGSATLHFRIAPGAHTVDLRPAEADPSDAPVFSQPVDLLPDLAFSVVVQGSADAPEAVVYEDILDPIDGGLARLAAIHAVPDADPVDLVRSDTAPLMIGVTYGTSYGTINIPSGVYDLLAIPTGGSVDEAVAEFGEVDLASGVLYTLLVAPDQAFVLPTPVNAGADETLVRFVHGSATTPAVDLYVDSTLVLTNLAFGEATLHAPLASGDHEVDLREAGTPPNSEALFTGDLSIEGAAQTVIVTAEDDEFTLTTSDDAVADVTAAQAGIQIVNLDAVAFDVTVGDQDLSAAPGLVGDVVAVEPGIYEINGEDVALFGGVLYTVIKPASSDATLSETPLSLGLTGLPFGQAAVEVAAVPAATEEPVATEEAGISQPAVTSTPAPGGELVAAATPVPAVTQSTELVTTPADTAPVVSPEVAIQPTAAPVQPNAGLPPTNVVRAIVALNQGVNLQCREYPSSAARSLGLIPNGTELIIEGLFAPRDTTGEIGRTDAITVENVPDFSQLPEEDFSVANIPAATIEALSLDDLWMDVTWILEDGTPFACWSNAFYLDMNYRNTRVDQVTKVLDLVDSELIDLVPYNVPGGPRDPNISSGVLTPPTPPPPDQILGIVNVNQGVRLQLRRTPSVTSESLALVPGGTQLIVFEKTTVTPTGNVGEPTSPDWLFVEFSTPEGVRVRGWVSAEYLSLTFRNRLYNLADVPVATEIQTGGAVTDDGAAVAPSNAAPPTPAGPNIEGRLLINPGAQLNLRDRPSEDGIVRQSVPSDAVLRVLGRNGAGTWVQVIFTTATGPVEGWVSAQFVGLTLQGAEYQLGQLPITNGEADSFVAPQ